MAEKDTFALQRQISTVVKKSPIRVTLDDGSVINLDSEDWGDEPLTRREKLFIFWYTFPYLDDLSCYHCASKSAVRAGYNPKHARQQGYICLRRNAELIAKMDAKFARATLDDAASRMVARKIQRATFDIADFYETSVLDDGRLAIQPKMLEEIPKEKRQLIDNVDNKNGVFVYELPNKQKEMDSILALKNMLDGNQPQQNTVNVNVLIDAIKERAVESQKIIAAHEVDAIEADGFMMNPSRLLEED